MNTRQKIGQAKIAFNRPQDYYKCCKLRLNAIEKLSIKVDIRSFVGGELNRSAVITCQDDGCFWKLKIFWTSKLGRHENTTFSNEKWGETKNYASLNTLDKQEGSHDTVHSKMFSDYY